MNIRIACMTAAFAFAAPALVMSLPVTAQEQTKTVGGAPMYASKYIIENAVNSKDHTTLVAAVKAAGLVETLQGQGPFTVFAPTNAAFAKLPAGTVDTLLKPENKADADERAHLSRRPRQDDRAGPRHEGQGRRRQGHAEDRRRARC